MSEFDADLYSDDDSVLVNARRRYIHRRWNLLHKAMVGSEEDVVKYLFLVNAGGAVAVLGFIGTGQLHQAVAWAGAALLFFVIGLLCVGALKTVVFHQYKRILEGFDSDQVSYLQGQMTWDQLNENDHSRSGISMAAIICGYCALLAFFAGTVCGGWALYDKYFYFKSFNFFL
ncbi:hypothetical protein QSV34_08985 [Porticoccus sp. W117]|uniref:hypothetical protein n=1 Tax=Porticoccus sp. W117 TaxID=3054777 RepID=UPI002591C0EC|nr:hypothetical protein [Porticoccus sp. W117]MDM3871489.1 hypothetical protein [Porticoccus sp. W117]